MIGNEEDPLNYIMNNLGTPMSEVEDEEYKDEYEEYSGYKYNMSNQLLYRKPPPSLLSDHDLDIT